LLGSRCNRCSWLVHSPATAPQYSRCRPSCPHLDTQFAVCEGQGQPSLAVRNACLAIGRLEVRGRAVAVQGRVQHKIVQTRLRNGLIVARTNWHQLVQLQLYLMLRAWLQLWPWPWLRLYSSCGCGCGRGCGCVPSCSCSCVWVEAVLVGFAPLGEIVIAVVVVVRSSNCGSGCSYSNCSSGCSGCGSDCDCSVVVV